MIKLFYRFFILVLTLVISLCSCKPAVNEVVEHSHSASGVYDFTSEWPENEFTNHIPKPSRGTVWYTYSFNNKEAFSVYLSEISMGESDAYVDELKSEGYALIAEESNDVSAGINMFKDDVYLSIAYSNGVLGIMIITDYKF